MQVYDAGGKMGGKTMPTHYPWRVGQKIAFNYELPTFHKNEKIAQLRFVEPVSLSFDTFPDYARYEIIPLVWDCWPMYFEKTCHWLIKHHVRTAVFTSSQTADRMKKRFPQMNILAITEGIDTSKYKEGKDLNERSIDLLEFGRRNKKVFNVNLPSNYKHLYSKNGEHLFKTEQDLVNGLSDSKITVCFPRCDTQPQKAGDIETLTQRYWEAMLSKIVIVGRAPKELVDLTGYNPVIEIDKDYQEEQIIDIIEHIDNYQNLVNKNRSVAIKFGDWNSRTKQIMDWLYNCNYSII
jgi:hypothetical protein